MESRGYSLRTTSPCVSAGQCLSYPHGPAVSLYFFAFVLVLIRVLGFGFMHPPHKMQKSEYEYRCAEYENEYEGTEKRADKSPITPIGGCRDGIAWLHLANHPWRWNRVATPCGRCRHSLMPLVRKCK